MSACRGLETVQAGKDKMIEEESVETRRLLIHPLIEHDRKGVPKSHKNHRMVPHVPPEIIGAIVDVLHDDKPTLAACTLVSSAWLPRSRFNLFRSLTYHVEPDGSGFIPFLDFLRSSPELTSFVHKLFLDGDFKIGTMLSKPSSPSYRHKILSYSTLLDILDSLPALSDFELRHVIFPRPPDWTVEEHRRFDTGTKREIALQRLNLRSIGHLKGDRPITRTHQSEFTSVLGIFSSVQELHVFEFSNPSMDPDGFRVQAPLGLRNPLYGQTQPLSLVAQDMEYVDEFWDVINHLSVPMRCLSLTGDGCKQVMQLKDFDTQLKNLQIDFMYTYNDYAPCLTGLDLSSCGALNDFTLWISATTRTSLPWTRTMSFLRNLPLGILRLAIYICCEDGCDLKFLEGEEPSEWEAIRSQLSRLSNLSGLSFVVQYGELYISDPKFADYKVFDAHLRTRFEQELSSLHEREILSISSSVVTTFGPDA